MQQLCTVLSTDSSFTKRVLKLPIAYPMDTCTIYIHTNHWHAACTRNRKVMAITFVVALQLPHRFLVHRYISIPSQYSSHQIRWIKWGGGNCDAKISVLASTRRDATNILGYATGANQCDPELKLTANSLRHTQNLSWLLSGGTSTLLAYLNCG